MERVQVISSNIKEVGYDPASSTLEIMFSDGRLYQYFDVSGNIYQELVAAASAGQYFHQFIRGLFRFARV